MRRLCCVVAIVVCTFAGSVRGETVGPRGLNNVITSCRSHMESKQYERFLRDLLPPADWAAIAADENLKTRLIKGLTRRHAAVLSYLCNQEPHFFFNADQTEAVLISRIEETVSHDLQGKIIETPKHELEGVGTIAVAFKLIGDRWYFAWSLRGDDFLGPWQKAKE